MTSKSREVIENTPQSSSGESIGVLAQPSKQSASSDNTQNSTQTLRKQSPVTSSADNSGLTTPKITEKTRQHATIAKVVLSQLLTAGLMKRYRVLSPDGTTVKEIQIVLDPSLWTEDFDLK
jgi:hypothetical protein